jgi:hypothetical protein
MGPALAAAAGPIVGAGLAAACLAGCDPASAGDEASDLSGCWSVQDTTYIEAGRTSYATGTLALSQRGADLRGEIAWDDPALPADSVSGRRNGDSLSLILIRKDIPERDTLKGSFQSPGHFQVTSDWWESRMGFSASRLGKCPDPLDSNPNPRKLQLRPAHDSIAVSHVDSAGLSAFASYAYSGDSDVVSFSKAYDTLTFTYRSYRDRDRSSKRISGGFSLLTTPQGEKVIYGNVYPYYDDFIKITDSTEYSLNENAVIPGGLPKGKYKLVIHLQVECYCLQSPNDFYVKEFTLE